MKKKTDFKKIITDIIVQLKSVIIPYSVREINATVKKIEQIIYITIKKKRILGYFKQTGPKMMIGKIY